jgi:hypothetical protein
MFQIRQVEEIIPLVEISFANITPGAVGNGTTVATVTAFTLGAAGSGVPATFALGDQIEIYASSGAATNGVIVTAAPTATPGTAQVYFQNATGGSITPVASSKYTIVATRLPATLVS